MNPKACTKCGKIKDRKDFSKRKGERLKSACKDCEFNYRATRKDSIDKRRKEHHIANREKNLVQMNAYYYANKEEILAKSKLYRAANIEKSRSAKRLYHYGLTKEQYDLMIVAQSGLCKICGKVEIALSKSGKVKPLSVDHDHSTGKIRGLLCNTCNRSLGLFKEDINNLTRAIDYLRLYQNLPAKG